MHDDTRFSGTGPCQNKQRALTMLDSFLLFGIKFHLLDSNTFGQISWLIDVRPFMVSNMISQEL